MSKVNEKIEEVVEDEVEDDKLDLVFPTATIVREMKKHIDSGKMIKKEVKVAMNQFLAEIVADVTKKMNEYPYAMLDYRMFKEASKPYRKAKEIEKEKNRMTKHLDVIIEDCNSIKRDLEEKFGEEKKI